MGTVPSGNQVFSMGFAYILHTAINSSNLSGEVGRVEGCFSPTGAITLQEFLTLLSPPEMSSKSARLDLKVLHMDSLAITETIWVR